MHQVVTTYPQPVRRFVNGRNLLAQACITCILWIGNGWCTALKGQSTFSSSYQDTVAITGSLRNQGLKGPPSLASAGCNTAVEEHSTPGEAPRKKARHSTVQNPGNRIAKAMSDSPSSASFQVSSSNRQSSDNVGSTSSSSLPVSASVTPGPVRRRQTPGDGTPASHRSPSPYSMPPAALVTTPTRTHPIPPLPITVIPLREPSPSLEQLMETDWNNVPSQQSIATQQEVTVTGDAEIITLESTTSSFSTGNGTETSNPVVFNQVNQVLNYTDNSTVNNSVVQLAQQTFVQQAGLEHVAAVTTHALSTQQGHIQEVAQAIGMVQLQSEAAAQAHNQSVNELAQQVHQSILGINTAIEEQKKHSADQTAGMALFAEQVTQQLNIIKQKQEQQDKEDRFINIETKITELQKENNAKHQEFIEEANKQHNLVVRSLNKEILDNQKNVDLKFEQQNKLLQDISKAIQSLQEGRRNSTQLSESGEESAQQHEQPSDKKVRRRDRRDRSRDRWFEDKMKQFWSGNPADEEQPIPQRQEVQQSGTLASLKYIQGDISFDEMEEAKRVGWGKYRISDESRDKAHAASKSSSSAQHGPSVEIPPRAGQAPEEAGTSSAEQNLAKSSKVKERDTCKLPALPNITGYDLWLAEVTQEIITGSGRGQMALAWFQEIASTEEALVEEKLNSPTAEMVTWDLKCMQGLRHVIRNNNELTTKVNLKIKEYQTKNKLFSFRGAMRLVQQYFTADPAKQKTQLLTEIQLIECHGIADMPTFASRWNALTAKCREVLCKDPELCESLLVTRLVSIFNRQPSLKEPFMNHYHQHKDDPDKKVNNVDWLCKQLDNFLQRIKFEKMTTEYEKGKAMEGKATGSGVTATPAATEVQHYQKGNKQPPNLRQATPQPNAQQREPSKPPTRPNTPRATEQQPWNFGEGIDLQAAFAAFLKGKGKGKFGKGKDHQKGKDKGGGKKGDKGKRTPTDSPNARVIKGKGKGGKGKEPCYYWVRFGNCSRGNDCGFDHAAELQKSNPDAQFPTKGYNAAVAANPGSAWIEAMLTGNRPPSSLNDTGNTGAATAITATVFSADDHSTSTTGHGFKHFCALTNLCVQPCNNQKTPISTSNRFLPLVKKVCFAKKTTVVNIPYEGKVE